MASNRTPVHKKTRPCLSDLEQACHHCPLVLFAFLSDADAASLACTCSAFSTICRRSYDIKRELPIRPVLAGLYPFVVRKVYFDGDYDQLSWVRKLPPTVTSLSVDDQENRWSIADLPRSLTHFSFVDASEHSALLASISTAEGWPSGLTSLQLDVPGEELPPLPSTLRAFGSSKLKVGGVCLPDSLTSLRLGVANDGLWLQLPPHLTTLEMQLSSDTTTEHLARLPASLTHLTLVGDEYVHRCFHSADKAVRLPSGLLYLSLVSVPYRAFRDLPSSLEHLIVKNASLPIGFWGFDGQIRHALLQILELPLGYNYPIAARHLPSLRELTLDGRLGQRSDGLPASLRKLTLQNFDLEQPLDRLPADLTELDLTLSWFYHHMARLPRRLLSLTLGRNFDQPLHALPSRLTRLDLDNANRFNRPLDNLPESLQVLILSRDFDYPLQQLPSSLRVLRFHPDCRFNYPLPPLPDSLSVLDLGNSFNQPLMRLPRGLTDLDLGFEFNHPLPLVKPEPALTPSNAGQEHRPPSSPSIYFLAADVDSQESKAMTYPIALRWLELGRCFNQPLSLPPSLTSLSVYSTHALNQILQVAKPSLPSTLTYLDPSEDYKWRDVDLEAVRERCPFLHIEEYDLSQ